MTASPSVLEHDSAVSAVQPLHGAPSTRRPGAVFCVIFVFILGLALLGFADRTRENPRLFWSFAGAVVVLLGWTLGLLISAWRNGRTLMLEVVVRPQHYLQACLQTTICAYWGWYWPQVYESYYLVI